MAHPSVLEASSKPCYIRDTGLPELSKYLDTQSPSTSALLLHLQLAQSQPDKLPHAREYSFACAAHALAKVNARAQNVPAQL